MRRALLLAVMMLGLAACRQEAALAPFAHSRTPPGLAGRFMAPEGWAWGYVQNGAFPPQRYGVAAPRGAPRGQLLIVVGSGQTAEAWFETVADLNGRGLTVWVLERAGQAGSGRFAGPRELIHAPSFDPDVGSLKAMVHLIVRPTQAAPLVLMGQGDGAVVALAAAERGLPVDGLILSTPAFAPAGAETLADSAMRRLGQARARASGWRAWTRDGPDDFKRGVTQDPWRGGVQHAWQTANPDLRMSGESLAWRQAFREAGAAATARAGEVGLPTLVIAPPEAAEAEQTCAAMPSCRLERLDGAEAAPHLQQDQLRDPWLAVIGAFVAPDRAPGLARHRL